MRIKHTFILALTFLSIKSFAQLDKTNGSELDSLKEKSISILDSLYLTGAKGYNEDIIQNTSFPRSSVLDGIEGLLIIEISVNENAEVSARFMTNLDDAIQEKATEYLIKTSNKWMYKGTPYKLYIPISFGQGSYSIEQIAGEVQGFPKKFEPPLLKATAWNIVRASSVRIRQEIDPNDPRSSKEMAEERVKEMQREGKLRTPPTKLTSDGAALKAYLNEKERLDKHLSKENFKKAYKSVIQLIRFNPFDISLLQQRVRLEKELGRDDYRKYDVPWISVLMSFDKQL